MRLWRRMFQLATSALLIIAQMWAAEAGLNAKDPMLAITGPLPITELSSRDVQHPMLNEQFAGLAL
jgi:hypothetical protein